MKRIALLILALGTLGFAQAQTSAGMSGTCRTGNDIDFTYNSALQCPSEASLAGRAVLGFHSGTSFFGGSIVNWDDAGATTAVNDGSGTFTWSVNTVSYYGIAADTLDNIQLVLNTGPGGGDPWDSVGRDTTPGGFGCADLFVDLADIPTCGVVACDASSAPTGVSSSVGATQIALSWNPIPASVACRVQGTRITPPGPSPSVNIFGAEPAGTNVPVSKAGPGTTWEWSVKCACSISPLVVTPSSATNTFSVPAPRLEDNSGIVNIYPNPASGMITLDYSSEQSDVAVFEITDLTGRVLQVSNEQLVEGANQIRFDISKLNSGVYFLMTEGMADAIPFTVK